MMLNKMSQREKNKNHMISKSNKLIDTENRRAISRGEGEWREDKEAKQGQNMVTGGD